MDEHYQHDNAGDDSARVQEFDSDAPGSDAKQPRQDRDQGSVGTFEAKAKDLGRKAEGLGRKVRTFSDGGELVTGGDYVYAWQRQVANFYGMRLRKNLEFGRRFAAAGDIADVIGLQCDYVRDTLLDYASSVYAMAGIGFIGARPTAERLDRSD